jgi:competence protein ComEC
MLSRHDTDHVGGAASLRAATEVRAQSSALPSEHALRVGGPAHWRCAAGQSWQWDRVAVQVLHPADEDYASPRPPNALNGVLRVSARSLG